MDTVYSTYICGKPDMDKVIEAARIFLLKALVAKESTDEHCDQSHDC